VVVVVVMAAPPAWPEAGLPAPPQIISLSDMTEATELAIFDGRQQSTRGNVVRPEVGCGVTERWD
jgi:hypothetical protein